MHVLFVCTGNLCRSPLAERLAQKLASDLGLEHFSASSAGTRAAIGRPMHPEAAAVLRSLGGDPSDFSAKQVTRKVATSADLIVTMEKAHRDAVLELAPQQLRRTFTLTEIARLVTDFGITSTADLARMRAQLTAADAPDMPDPIGQPAEVFSSVGTRISELVPALFRLQADA